jgi:hypothetical protein
MKKTILATLAVAALCAMPLAASAQDVRVRAGERGVVVRTDGPQRPGWHHRHRGHVEERVIRRGDRRTTIMTGPRCRTVAVRTVRPNGDVVIRRSQHCR